jgi:hypothetical protein
MKLKPVGFFRELEHGLPDGPSLATVRSDNSDKEEGRILRYLQCGVVVVASPGVVRDVLDERHPIIGSCDILTDGSWAWPTDLVHYVRRYHVLLPTQFVDFMRQNQWKVPKKIDVRSLEIFSP